MPTAPCFLIKVFLINFRFVLVNTQRMQYCTMRCHCPTIQLCHDTIMQLCLLCILPCNPSASWKITIGGCIYIKVWQQRRLSQIILEVVRLDLALKECAWKMFGGCYDCTGKLPTNSKNLANCCFPRGLLAFLLPKEQMQPFWGELSKIRACREKVAKCWGLSAKYWTCRRLLNC